MRRYMELIRDILEYAEQKGNGKQLIAPEINGYTPDQVNEHIKLCCEAGYLEIVLANQATRHYHIGRLTWQGHEFLDKHRGGTGSAMSSGL